MRHSISGLRTVLAAINRIRDTNAAEKQQDQIRLDAFIVLQKELGEQIQSEYPGAVVHNIYPAQYNSNSALRITGIKRYQPERLSWSD